MRVSVIIPAYNCEGYIAATIRSIAAQTVRDLEIVVVDDGSKDATLEVARREAAQDSRVVVISQPNSGAPGAARNRGIRACHGEFIAFLDADDLYEPDKLQRELAAFEACPDVDLVFSDVARFFNATPDRTVPGILQSGGFVEAAASHLERHGEDLYRCKPSFYSFMSTDRAAVATQTVMVRRAALLAESVWFPEDWVCGEDLDLWFRLARRVRMAYIDRVLAWYRQRPGSVMHDDEKAVIGAIKAHGTNLNRALDVLTSAEVALLRRRLATHYFQLGYLRYRKGRMSSAREAFRDARRLAREEYSRMAYLKTFLPGFLVRFLIAARDGLTRAPEPPERRDGALGPLSRNAPLE
jgi:glycosyltransferase involved in cell wall biosynthesis